MLIFPIFGLPLLIALVFGLLGVMHTRELGGRMAAILYAVPALIPSLWLLEFGFQMETDWKWLLLAASPMVLAWFTIFYGFRSQNRGRNFILGTAIVAGLMGIVSVVHIWPEPIHRLGRWILPGIPMA